MANKTRLDIITQLYKYLPTVNNSAHTTMINNLIDQAAEEISLRHNFTYLRATTPATYSAAQGTYYIDESSFSFTNFKELLDLQWIKTTTGENAPIRWLPEEDFRKRYPYVEYSGNTQGKPVHYTRYANRIHLSHMFDEAVTVRAYYQQLHGNFTDDTTSHSFQPDNMGYQALLSCVVGELREVMPGLAWTQIALQCLQKKSLWIEQLIIHDLRNADEEIEIEPADRRMEDYASVTDSYDWVT